MMGFNITREQFTEAINIVVEEFGREYVYEKILPGEPSIKGMCNYVHEGAPSCLIAHALVRFGVPTQMLSKYEGIAANSVLEELTTLPRDVREAALIAQSIQDNDESWGEALDAYEETLGPAST